MTKRGKAEREGTKRDGSTVRVGDFIFEGYKMEKYGWFGLSGNSWEKDKKAYEKRVYDLMAMHYEFYNQFQTENEYVTKGSILCCDQGTNLTRFDMLKDHALKDPGDIPIGTCNDCEANYNIYTFGGCYSTLHEDDHKRVTVSTYAGGSEVFIGNKCIPMLNSS